MLAYIQSHYALAAAVAYAALSEYLGLNSKAASNSVVQLVFGILAKLAGK